MSLLDLLLALDGRRVLTDGRSIFITGSSLLTPQIRAGVEAHYSKLASMLKRVRTAEGIAP